MRVHQAVFKGTLGYLWSEYVENEVSGLDHAFDENEVRGLDHAHFLRPLDM